jgi:acyl-CoA synthetase (AMP-forming)/AMP-acid ligase II
MFVASMLRRSAAAWPDRVAIVDGERRVTYRELADRVARLATGLRALGLEPGDRVVDLQYNAATYIETDLACAVARLVRVPVNTRLTVDEWRYIVDDCGARAIVHGAEFTDVAVELASGAGEPPLRIAVGGGPPGLGYEELIERAAPGAEGLTGRPGDIVSLNYSSGTTGRPKGCIRTSRNRFASTVDILTSLFDGRLGAGDVFLHAGPITHASGLFVLPHLAVGATQVVLPRFDAELAVAAMEAHGVTGTVLVPTMLERVVAVLADRGEPEPLPALRRVLYAGAPMRPERIAAANAVLGDRLVQFYGLVEAIPPLTVLGRADHAEPALLSSAGRPVLGVAVTVTGPDGEPVPMGEVGELAIGGDHVMDGYWDNPDSTVKAVVDGWLRTGDMARLDERGYVFLVDRKADMIITGGYNVMPREVELVIAEDPAVAEAAVVGLPDPDWGEAVTAFVVAAPGASVDVERLRDLCAARLSGFKKPKRIVVVDDLPRSSTGKVARGALKRSEVGSPG